MVEDNPVNMLIAVAQLEQWGAVVGQAHDGRAAVEAVARAADEGHPFDVVLMDLQMPQMGGIEAARALRRVLCGGRVADHRAHRRCARLGAPAGAASRNERLRSKPIDPDQLLRALARALPAGRAKPALDTQ